MINIHFQCFQSDYEGCLLILIIHSVHIWEVSLPHGF